MDVLAKFALACVVGAGLPAWTAAQTVTRYSGPCDASAAVALDGEHFVVANDETNVLHVYRQGRPQPVGTFDLSKFLGTPTGEEADIEGVAAIGTRIYWITSHGRNGRGKAQPSRQRFFATDVRPGPPPTLAPLGVPYTRLLHDLTTDPALKRYKLDEAARLAPEADGGLNIEGLAGTADGELLIGLRNPLSHRRALVIPLKNPGELISGMPAKFGPPVELDLGQRGIRSIERIGASFLIVAGPTADSGSFALFRWSGQAGEAPVALPGVALQDLRPEALFVLPQTDRVQLLSDDGGLRVDGIECKKLPPAQQSFRSLTLKP